MINENSTGGEERFELSAFSRVGSDEVLVYLVTKSPQVGAEIPFLYLTPESIFSNQPADFLKQLERSEKLVRPGTFHAIRVSK
jgi:hypothetical protein